MCLQDLGEDSDEMRYVGISVVPIRWASAVSIMQDCSLFDWLGFALAGAGLSEQAGCMVEDPEKPRQGA